MGHLSRNQQIDLAKAVREADISEDARNEVANAISNEMARQSDRFDGETFLAYALSPAGRA